MFSSKHYEIFNLFFNCLLYYYSYNHNIIFLTYFFISFYSKIMFSYIYFSFIIFFIQNSMDNLIFVSMDNKMGKKLSKNNYDLL